jgi:hypothetical protein
MVMRVPLVTDPNQEEPLSSIVEPNSKTFYYNWEGKL